MAADKENIGIILTYNISNAIMRLCCKVRSRVGAFSVIVQPVVKPMDRYTALVLVLVVDPAIISLSQ